MSHHDLVISPGPFASLWDGSKATKLLRTGRTYRAGDMIRLAERGAEGRGLSHRAVIGMVTRVTELGPYVLVHLCVTGRVIYDGPGFLSFTVVTLPENGSA